MRDSGVHVEGLTKLIRGLERAGIEVQDLKEAFSSISKQAASLASSFAPRVSGRLAASVRGNKAKNKAVIRAGRAAVPYAGVVEYGWSAKNRPAAGFMRRADDAVKPTVVPKLEAELNRLLREKF